MSKMLEVTSQSLFTQNKIALKSLNGLGGKDLGVKVLFKETASNHSGFWAWLTGEPAQCWVTQPTSFIDHVLVHSLVSRWGELLFSNVLPEVAWSRSEPTDRRLVLFWAQPRTCSGVPHTPPHLAPPTPLWEYGRIRDRSENNKTEKSQNRFFKNGFPREIFEEIRPLNPDSLAGQVLLPPFTQATYRSPPLVRGISPPKINPGIPSLFLFQSCDASFPQYLLHCMYI